MTQIATNNSGDILLVDEYDGDSNGLIYDLTNDRIYCYGVLCSNCRLKSTYCSDDRSTSIFEDEFSDLITTYPEFFI